MEVKCTLFSFRGFNIFVFVFFLFFIFSGLNVSLSLYFLGFFGGGGLNGSVVPATLCVVFSLVGEFITNKLPFFWTADIVSHKTVVGKTDIYHRYYSCSQCVLCVVKGSYSFQDTDLSSNGKRMAGLSSLC